LFCAKSILALGTTNTTASLPASVVADAITVLSGTERGQNMGQNMGQNSLFSLSIFGFLVLLSIQAQESHKESPKSFEKGAELSVLRACSKCQAAIRCKKRIVFCYRRNDLSHI